MKIARIQLKPDENYCLLNFCSTFFCWSLWWTHLGWMTGDHPPSVSLLLQYNKRLVSWDKEGHSPTTIMGKTDFTWGNWRSEKPNFSGDKGNMKYIFYRLVHKDTRGYFTFIELPTTQIAKLWNPLQVEDYVEICLQRGARVTIVTNWRGK